jgi:hypothetical protein
METLKIVGICILSAIFYGVLHDQVTVRVCVEYFTMGHPPIFLTDEPTILALGWGVLATWWVGLSLGLPLALVCRVGSLPKYSTTSLLRPICCLLLAMGIFSLIAGVIGFFVAEAGGVWLLEPLSTRVPREKHSLFLADLWAHLAAYGGGFIGGIGICIWILLRRYRSGQDNVTIGPIGS